MKPQIGQLQKLKNVQRASDFGLVGGSGVITLADDTAYRILGTVDLQGNRLVLGDNTTIFGVNANSSILKSTGLSSSTALITGTEGCKFYDLGFEGGLIFDLSGDSSTGLDWRDLNFVDCEVGTIENFTNFVGSVFGFFNSHGLVFDEIVDTIALSDTIFSVATGETMLTIPATATTITTQGVYVKVAGATTAGDFVAKFDVDTTDNRAVYLGSKTGFYNIRLTASLSGANNAQYGMRIYKNDSGIGVVGKATTNAGGRAENLSTETTTTLSTDDYIEIWIAGLDGTSNPTVDSMNVSITRLN